MDKLTFKDTLKMQQILDTKIVENLSFPRTSEELLHCKIVGLVSEVGEFTQECNSWKFWKKTKKQDRSKILRELTDIRFMIYSIANQLNFTAEELNQDYIEKFNENINRQNKGY